MSRTQTQTPPTTSKTERERRQEGRGRGEEKGQIGTGYRQRHTHTYTHIQICTRSQSERREIVDSGKSGSGRGAERKNNKKKRKEPVESRAPRQLEWDCGGEGGRGEESDSTRDEGRRGMTYSKESAAANSQDEAQPATAQHKPPATRVADIRANNNNTLAHSDTERERRQAEDVGLSAPRGKTEEGG